MVYKCNFCQKDFITNQALISHSKFCKLNLNNLNLSNPLNQIKEYNFICPKCGKKYSLNLKIRDFEKGHYMKFCSRSCANSRIRTDEIKRKISEATKKVIAIPKEHVCPKCGKKFIFIGCRTSNVFCENCKKTIGDKHNSKEITKTKCNHCGIEIFTKHIGPTYCYECAEKFGFHSYRLFDQNGKKLVSQSTRKKNSEISKLNMKLGKIKPWLSRNIISYAERFWRKVLSLNKIDYQPEKPEHGYFLDFVIETKSGLIDLEIDGKQHWNDLERSQHDKERDKVLTELGYKVYRVPWNTLNTLEGKEQMRSKIQNFLTFYKNLN